METDDVSFIPLEIHPTKDVKDDHLNGTLTVIWRDWDKTLKDEPKMMYVTSVNPGEVKGPHLHLKRDSYFVCIHGKVVIIAKNKSGKYIEIETNSEKPTLVYVPKNLPSAHLNLSNEISRVLVISNISWKPNDNEMENVSFNDYDWNKWKKY